MKKGAGNDERTSSGFTTGDEPDPDFSVKNIDSLTPAPENNCAYQDECTERGILKRGCLGRMLDGCSDNKRDLGIGVINHWVIESSDKRFCCVVTLEASWAGDPEEVHAAAGTSIVELEVLYPVPAHNDIQLVILHRVLDDEIQLSGGKFF